MYPSCATRGSGSSRPWLATLVALAMVGVPGSWGCDLRTGKCNNLRIELTSELFNAGFHLKVGCAASSSN